MNQKIFQIFLALLITLSLSLGFPNIALADDNHSSIAPTSTTDITPTKTTTMFCPPIENLTKDPTTRMWNVNNDPNWEPYELSFEDKLNHFSGAQWHGTNIGQVFCIYHGPTKTSFPVLILFNVLTLEPTSGKWGPKINDYRNCVAEKTTDCPFVIKVAEHQDLYKGLEQLKQKSPQELGY